VNRLLRVADRVDGGLVSMPRVLAALVPEAYALSWSVLDLGEVVADERWDLNLPFIEQRVDASPRGFELSFADLSAFSERVRQVVDGLFVGCADPARLPRRTDDDATILERADMLVAATHGGWLVSADDELLFRYEARFEEVSELGAGSVELPGWSG
jgi:hypothetical protein